MKPIIVGGRYRIHEVSPFGICVDRWTLLGWKHLGSNQPSLQAALSTIAWDADDRGYSFIQRYRVIRKMDDDQLLITISRWRRLFGFGFWQELPESFQINTLGDAESRCSLHAHLSGRSLYIILWS